MLSIDELCWRFEAVGFDQVEHRGEEEDERRRRRRSRLSLSLNQASFGRPIEEDLSSGSTGDSDEAVGCWSKSTEREEKNLRGRLVDSWKAGKR